MGVPSLMSYVESHAKLLRKRKINNSYIVIDGDNMAHRLYKQTPSCMVFGGDYDAYHHVVKNFFQSLEQCKITPIVVLKGGRLKKEVNSSTIKQKMSAVENLQNRFSNEEVLPIHTIAVFYNLLHQLGVLFNRSYLSHNDDAPGVAKHLNCPILSYDSKYFLMDVECIPTTTLKWEHPMEDTKHQGIYYLNCYSYKREYILDHFQGLNLNNLPLLSIFICEERLNRDKIDSIIRVQSKPSMHYNHRKLEAVLQWLATVDFNSASNKLLSLFNEKEKECIRKIITETVNFYKIGPPSEFILSKLPSVHRTSGCTIRTGSDTSENASIDEDFQELLKKLPSDFLKKYRECKIIQFSVMDMLHLNFYVTSPMVEDLSSTTCYDMSIPIIKAMYYILCELRGEPGELVVSFAQSADIKISLSDPSLDCLKGVNVMNLREESLTTRQNIIFSILKMDDGVKSMMEGFRKEWKLFIICVVYWFKHLDSEFADAHLLAMIFMLVANYVQTKVGYYENEEEFERDNREKLDSLGDADSNGYVACNNNEYSPDELLNRISSGELLLFTKKFISCRKADEEINDKGYSIRDMHVFSVFQCFIFHLIQLNSLLEYPFDDLVMADLFSGTLLCNIFYKLKNKRYPIQCLLDEMNESPNLSLFILDKFRIVKCFKEKLQLLQ